MASGEDKKLTDVTLDEFIAALNSKQDDGLPVLPVLGSVGPWIKLVHTIGLPWAMLLGGGWYATQYLLPVLKDIHTSTDRAGTVVKEAVEAGSSQRHTDIADLKTGQKEISEAVEAKAADPRSE